jgi:hypothetical protein
MTTTEPLSEMATKAEAYLAELRRQAPAARMIGEFAVKKGIETVMQRLQMVAPNPVRADVKPTTVVADSQIQVEPLDSYDTLTARQIIETLGTLTSSQLQSILDYEILHRNRVTVAQACRRALKDSI